MGGILLDGGEHLERVAFSGVLAETADEFVDGSNDEGEWSAQVVAHVGEEPCLHFVQFFFLFLLLFDAEEFIPIVPLVSEIAIE